MGCLVDLTGSSAIASDPAGDTLLSRALGLSPPAADSLVSRKLEYAPSIGRAAALF